MVSARERLRRLLPEARGVADNLRCSWPETHDYVWTRGARAEPASPVAMDRARRGLQIDEPSFISLSSSDLRGTAVELHPRDKTSPVAGDSSCARRRCSNQLMATMVTGVRPDYFSATQCW